MRIRLLSGQAWLRKSRCIRSDPGYDSNPMPCAVSSPGLRITANSEPDWYPFCRSVRISHASVPNQTLFPIDRGQPPSGRRYTLGQKCRSSRGLAHCLRRYYPLRSAKYGYIAVNSPINRERIYQNPYFSTQPFCKEF